MKILDLSNDNSKEKLLVINPTFTVYGKTIRVEYLSKNNKFRIKCGCESFLISKDNINDILFELDGNNYPTVIIQVITPKTRKAAKSDPKLKDEAGNWYISANDRAYEKLYNRIENVEIKPKKKWFFNNMSGWNKKERPITFRGNEITKTEIKNIKEVLQKIKTYLDESTIEYKQKTLQT